MNMLLVIGAHHQYLQRRHVHTHLTSLDAAIPEVDHHAVDHHAVDHDVAPKGCVEQPPPIIGQLVSRQSSGAGIKRRNPGPVAPADCHLVEADLEAEVGAEGMLTVMRQGLQYLCAEEHRCVGGTCLVAHLLGSVSCCHL